MIVRKMNSVLLLLAVFFTARCSMPEGSGSPYSAMPIPSQKTMTNGSPMGMILYVDTATENPLNAGDYLFNRHITWNKIESIPFFDYVVLSYAYLTKVNGYTRIELSDPLRRILDDNRTYLVPLHRQGIRVLIELRSGNYNDAAEDGVGAGLGTMDLAAINEFKKELKTLVNHYGIDGFDFNDVGGGKNSYPPYTEYLTHFQSSEPLYPEELFLEKGSDGKPLVPHVRLSAPDIEAILWRESGSNFSDLILNINEELKETITTNYAEGTYPEGVASASTNVVLFTRAIMVRKTNSGAHLLATTREPPDAYSGADPKLTGNLTYVINDTPYDMSGDREHPYFEGEAGNVNDGKYAPLTIDLQDNSRPASTLVGAFPSKYPAYGALFFTNLKPVTSSATTQVTYLSDFARILFGGDEVVLRERSGAGDYRKDW